MSEQDKPLPVSFWGDVQVDHNRASAGNPTYTDQKHAFSASHEKHASGGNLGFFQAEEKQVDPMAIQYDQWRASFAEMGYDVEEAYVNLSGSYSTVMQRVVNTIEDIYRHLQGVFAQANAVVVPEQQSQQQENESAGNSTEKPRTRRTAQASAERRSQIEQAGKDWREAIQQRKAAIQQWDDYVKSKHMIFMNLRDGKEDA